MIRKLQFNPLNILFMKKIKRYVFIDEVFCFDTIFAI